MKKNKRTFRYWRTLIPALFFMVFAVLSVRLTYPLPPDASLLLWLSRMEPIGLFSELRWSGEVQSWMWLPAAVLLFTLLLGRVFCGWLCPLGGLPAMLDSLRLRRSRSKPLKRNALRNRGPGGLYSFLRSHRYYWLFLILLLVALRSNLPLFLTPYNVVSRETARWFLGFLPWMLTAIVVIGVVLFPRFWCAYLCPTGVFLSLLSLFRRWKFNIDPSCTRCGRCEVICPTRAIAPENGEVGEECILCGRCWEKCPADAVTWGASRRSPQREDISRPGRRGFIKAGAAAAAAAVVWVFLQPLLPFRLLRPPGAQAEERFVSLCSRCGRCIKVCPNQALQPAPLAAGLANFETPHLVPRIGRCDLCLLCQEVCPTGAIARVPLERVKIGTAVLDENRCLVWNQGINCLLCQEQCPTLAVSRDKNGRPVVDQAACIGCGACENGCPVEGAAIHVYR